MYTTLHSASLKEIHVRNASDFSHGEVSSLTGKPKRARSKSGCLSCRSRKKKCDEQRPACGYCGPRGIECVYPKVEKMASKSMKENFLRTRELSQSIREINEKSTAEQAIITSPEPLFISKRSKLLTCQREWSPFVLDRLCAQQVISDQPRLVEVNDAGQPLDREQLEVTVASQDWNSPSFLIEPSSPFRLLLNERTMHLVSYFYQEVVNFVSIIPPANKNHLADTYMSISVNEESILALLATWGSLFIDGPNSDSFKLHLNHARQVASQKFERRALSDMEKFIMLCFHAGIAGIGICSGDTMEWYELLQTCKSIISDFGSVREFLSKFNYLNQAKHLVAELQYHDVMSSISMRNGTLLDMSEYAAVFEDESDFSYGIDPLQGCIHPVFLLLGEIINAKVELLRELKEVEDELTSASGFTLDDTDRSRALNRKRLKHYFKANEIAGDLMAKVEACEPKQNQQCFLSSNDLEEHLTLFEAFRNICKLHILLYIQGLKATAPEIQLILVDTFKLIDLLIASRLRSAICMVLLMCGICCYYPVDRAQIKKQFAQLQSNYKVFNVLRIQQIVEQSWDFNPHGDINVNWVELCEKLGWILAAS